ncbi:class II histone deacetylase [Marinomonas piezotolerans]|uniref:Class II histone deacetylase n=1 Tax=Marinomonas piezotolerans TaxID=2213058 RepID=A0A370UDA0_9GAMM|nr:class II histone deacetylase [Marinomonas piezotolerans]RDL45665.1 class II histone deacetylase [Marinomonas piezotolerans]
MKDTAFYFDERCFWHISGQYADMIPVGGWVQPPAGSGNTESPETKRRLKNLIDASGLGDQLHCQSAPSATREDMLRIHTEQYIDKFQLTSEQGGGVLGEAAIIGPGSFEIAAKSAGLVMQAVSDVMEGKVRNAYALSRPPGHHCLPDEAMGFCFLANIPIAIEHAKQKFGVKRVAVVDWDVHHGNGVQAIYGDSSEVLGISLHQENCFPPGYSGAEDTGVGEGKGYNINIPFVAGSGHDAYMHAMESIVVPALERYQPELIMVACGYDANAVDPLARMLLHSDSFRAMTECIKSAAERLCNGRLVLAHEGGYSEAYVPFCGLATMEALSGIKTEVQDPLLDFIKLQQPNSDAELFHKQHLDAVRQLVL